MQGISRHITHILYLAAGRGHNARMTALGGVLGWFEDELAGETEKKLKNRGRRLD